MAKHFNKKFTEAKRRFLRTHQTPAEKTLWHYLRRKQVQDERFLRQFSVDKYVIDFYCPRLKLGIELDGAEHYGSHDRVKYDKNRTKYLEKFGIKIIRFKDEEVLANNESVLERINDEVETRKLLS